MLRIHTGKQQQTLHQCKTITSLVQQLPYHYYHNVLNAKSYHLTRQCAKLQEYFQSSIHSYENVEHQIQSKVSLLNTIKEQPISKEPFWNTNVSTNKLYTKFHTSFSTNKPLSNYVKNGICVGLFASYHMAQAKVSKHYSYLDMEGSIGLGNFQARGDAKLKLFEDDKFKPSVEIEAEASISLLEGCMKATLGTSYLNVEGELKGEVGVARAEAKCVLKDKEVEIKAEYGAALARGTAKTTFNFFGKKVTLEAVGEAGALGASAEFSSKKGEWSFGGKISCLFGGGFKVTVKD